MQINAMLAIIDHIVRLNFFELYSVSNGQVPLLV